MTPETFYTNQASSLNRGSPVLLSVTPSRNVSIQVVWGRFSLAMFSWSDLLSVAGMIFLVNVWRCDKVVSLFLKALPLPMHTVVWPIREVVTRAFRKRGSSTRVGGRPFLIIASWGETIPDNHLTPTFYKLSLGRCSHQNSLSVAETWALSIGITWCINIHRSVCTTSNWHQVAFCRCIRFCKQSLSVSHHVTRISACTS